MRMYLTSSVAIETSATERNIMDELPRMDFAPAMASIDKQTAVAQVRRLIT